jgi:hypothetical protein
LDGQLLLLSNGLILIPSLEYRMGSIFNPFVLSYGCLAPVRKFCPHETLSTDSAISTRRPSVVIAHRNGIYLHSEADSEYQGCDGFRTVFLLALSSASTFIVPSSFSSAPRSPTSGR